MSVTAPAPDEKGKDEVASVSSLRARFEQLSGPSNPSVRAPVPAVSPKPSGLGVASTNTNASGGGAGALRKASPIPSSSAPPASAPSTSTSSHVDSGTGNAASNDAKSQSSDGIQAPAPLRPPSFVIRPRATSDFAREASSSDDGHNHDVPLASRGTISAAGHGSSDRTSATVEVDSPSSSSVAPPSRSRSSSTNGVNTSRLGTVSPVQDQNKAALDSESIHLRPLPRLSTRPSSTVSPSPASSTRKTPPPVPPSRKSRATSPVPPLPSDLSVDTQVTHSSQPSSGSGPDGTPLSPSLALGASVKSLASRFAAAESQHRRTRAATDSVIPSVLMTLPSPIGDKDGDALSRSASPVEATLAYSDEEEQQAEEDLEHVDTERIRSESPEELRFDRSRLPPSALKPRPAIPPRPSLNVASSEYSPSSAPAIPQRSTTSPVIASASLSSMRLPSPSAGVDVARSSSSSGVPAPPRKIVPPIKKQSDPIRVVPKVPTRPNASISSPPPFTPPIVSEPLYVPPPPPSRSLAANERLAPQRPIISATSDEGGGSSDEDDEADSSTFSKSQELPDATFANRRPPLLRDRRTIHPQGQFYSFALRAGKVVTGQHHVYVWNTAKSATGTAESVALPGEHKVHAIEFAGRDGRFVWAGTKDGHLFEVDTIEKGVTFTRHHVHAASVVGIFRVGKGMLSIDDSGKVLIWGNVLGADGGGEDVALSGAFKSQRVPEKQNFHAIVGTELWTASGPQTKSSSSALAMRSPQIRVFDTTGQRPWVVLPRPLTTPDSVGHIGSVTASAIVPALSDLVFLGHDNGYVSVWNRLTYVCEKVQRVSPFMATSMVGVGKDLWVGFRTGMISVLDVASSEVWTVKKAWKAHRDPVLKLVVDPTSLWTDSTLQVASAGTDVVIQLWDALLRDDWLDAELHLRQPEYCTFRSIKTLCVSWNVDASRPHDLIGTTQNLGFLNDVLLCVDSPDIISFGFQEMINLEDKKLTAKSMLLGKKKGEQKFADGISSSYRIWHDKLVQAVRLAMPPESPYTVVHVGDMIGLFSCIFVKTSEAAELSDVAKITVKTGMGGRYGNKGAILSRFVIDDTSICFVNCHLAAGQTHRRQRDHDLVDILEDKSTFSELGASSPGAYALGSGGTTVFDHELVILSGDLNYRIDARRETVVQAIKEGNYAALLPHDQLLKGMATNQTFRLRSFKEAPITFAPTYKYDPGTDEYDTSTKKRIPAWCDRVLYRADRADKVRPLSGQYRRWEVNVSDHRPISSAFEMRIKRIVPDKRALVWAEVESAWKGVEASRLDEARDYYKEW